MKRLSGVFLLALATSVSAFAIQQPARQHFHAHVISRTAMYTYRGTKVAVKEAAKPIVYVGKQVV